MKSVTATHTASVKAASMNRLDLNVDTATSPAETLEVVYPSHRASAARMRRALRAFLVRRAVEPAVVAQVVLAADEAFVNALAHGGGDVVRVSARVTQAEAAVEVRDRGAGFSPPASRIAAPDVDSPHGRGLFLMERLMDSVHICSGRDGTTVRMVRRLARSRDDSDPSMLWTDTAARCAEVPGAA